MKVLQLLPLAIDRPLAKLILICFLSILSHACLYAYDFEVKVGYDEIPLYFNVLSYETGHKTCELTYRSKEVKDGEVVYNPGYDQPVSGYYPSSVVYEGEEYLIVGIGDHAFENTDCYWFVCPDSAKYVGIAAFKNCKKLDRFCFKRALKNFRKQAFEDCVSLEGVYEYEYPYGCFQLEDRSSLSLHIGSKAFHGCTRLDVFDLNAFLPEQIKVEDDAFDIIDRRIDCDLWVTPCHLYQPILFIDLFSEVEPWKFFNIVEDDGNRITKEMPVCGQDKTNTDVYNLTGQKIGDTNSFPQLGHGIYIVNGKKYLK